MGGGNSKPSISYDQNYYDRVFMKYIDISDISVIQSLNNDHPFLFPFMIAPEFESEKVDYENFMYRKVHYISNPESCCLGNKENDIFTCDPATLDPDNTVCFSFFEKNCIDDDPDKNPRFCKRTLNSLISLSAIPSNAEKIVKYYNKNKYNIPRVREMLKMMRQHATSNNILNLEADKILTSLHKQGYDLPCSFPKSKPTLSDCERAECTNESFELLLSSNIKNLSECENILCINNLTFTNDNQDANISSNCFTKLEDKDIRSDFQEGFDLPFRIIPLPAILATFILLLFFIH